MRRVAAIASILTAITVLAALPASIFSFSPHFPPESSYNPIDDIKSWQDQRYLREHGTAFLGSQSRAESSYLKSIVDADIAGKPAREARLSAMLAIDALVGLGLAGLWLARAARRRAAAIKEAALDAAATSLKGARKASASIRTLGREIQKRADPQP